ANRPASWGCRCLRDRACPTASYTGTAVPVGDGYHVDGQLQLAGGTQPLAFDVRKDGATYRAEFELQPSRWGIAQYKAMFGAIKLKDLFKVELALSELHSHAQ
ncbi:MAG: YceI family protein, partial [Pseudomonadota bacterium]